MIYRFGRFELDEQAGELRRSGEPVTIQPKPLALLFLLLRERDRVVPQEEIFEALWPGTIVTSGSITRAVSHARRAIEDTNKGSAIRSYPKRGYRFMGDVVAVGDEETRASEAKKPGITLAPPARSTSPAEVFVGRDAALASLEEARRLAERAPGRLVLISGAAGVGKTRLAEFFSSQATAQGAAVLFGRSREGEGVPAFWLWSQVLRELTAAGLGRADADFEGLLADLGRDDDAEQRFRFFDSVSRALVEASRARPLVLVLEDLQWAQSPSLRLLEHLSFELADARILLIGTMRDEKRPRGHAIDHVLPILRRHEAFEEIDLAGLSRRAIADLLEQVIGRPAPAELTSEIFAKTEGVPLFVREAVRLLDERGDLKHPERISRRGISLPRHAVDLIRRSLDGLSRESADLVAAGSVLGREFTIGHVTGVAEIDPESALDLLEEGVEAGVLEEVPDTAATYRFTHALFQETAYETLRTRDRARFHARAAARLETQYADSPAAVIAELAHHHHQSIAIGDPDVAFQYATLAALEASRVLAYEQAATHYEQALDALDHAETIDALRRLAVLLDLGEAHRHAGDRERRRSVTAEAMEAARTLRRTTDFALAAIRFCDVNEWSPADDAALAAVEEALQIVDEEEKVLRARLMTRRAYLHIREDIALEIAREAAHLAREAGDPEAIQEALYVLMYALAGPDHLEERRALRDDISTAASIARSRESSVIALLDLSSDYLALGDPNLAQEVRDEVDLLIGDQPSLAMSWHRSVFDAGRALLHGRIDGVEQQITDALMLGKRLAHPYAQVCFEVHLMQMHLYRREYEAIEKLFAPGMTTTMGASHWPRAIYARNQIRLDNPDRGRELWEELARADFTDVARGIRWIATLVEYGHLCADLEDVDRAKKLITVLAPVEHLHGVMPMTVLYGGPASHALARMHEFQGDADTAIDFYERALEATSALEARPVRARILRDMAAPIARRGDSDRAAKLEQEGAALADEIACHL